VGKIEKSIEIEKDAAIVWNTLTGISSYRSWNPVVSHAAIYGPVASGTGIKTLIGKWDFEFTIIKVHAPRVFELRGSSIGINLKISFIIDFQNGKSLVRAKAGIGGWIHSIFKKRVETGVEDSLEIFLNSLKNRASGGGSYEIKREESKNDETRSGNISMPTPFNLIYKTRARKFRRGGLRLK